MVQCNWLLSLTGICIEWGKGFAIHINYTLQCHDSGVSARWRERWDYNPSIWQCSGLCSMPLYCTVSDNFNFDREYLRNGWRYRKSE